MSESPRDPKESPEPPSDPSSNAQPTPQSGPMPPHLQDGTPGSAGPSHAPATGPVPMHNSLTPSPGPMPPHAPQSMLPPPKPKSKALPIVLIAVGAVAALCLVLSVVGVGVGYFVYSSDGSNQAQDTEDTAPELHYGDGEHHIDYYYDFACPPCGESMRKLGPLLQDGIDRGKLEVTMHPISFVERADGYGVDAASASVCAATYGQNEFFGFTQTAMETVPGEDDTRPSNGELAGMVDLDDDFAACVEDSTYAGHVQEATSQSLANGVSQVPTVKVDGTDVAFEDAEEKIDALVN